MRSNRCLHTAGTVLLLSSKKFFLATTSTDPSPICHRQHVKWVMVKTVRAKWGETEWCLSCHAVPGNCAQKGNSQKALAKLSKISSKKWGILDHSCFSLLYKQIKQISTLFQSAKYTPHRHIALLGMIAALSRDFSLPPISITRVVRGQSWHFQGSFN